MGSIFHGGFSLLAGKEFLITQFHFSKPAHPRMPALTNAASFIGGRGLNVLIANADCRGAVHLRNAKIPPATIDVYHPSHCVGAMTSALQAPLSPYYRRTNSTPSPYQGRFIFGFRYEIRR